jgi:hypothetical protein
LGLKFSSLFLRILGVSRHDAKRKTGNKKASELQDTAKKEITHRV